MTTRRSFLTVATLAASGMGAGTLTVGCGAAAPRTVLASSEARAMSARLERGMRALADRPFGSMLSGPPESRPDLREHVLRLTLESMMVLDVLRAIPEGTAVPPELGVVLGPMLPRLDRAIHTHHALLARMPEAHARNVDRTLRTRPTLAMDAAEWLDARAVELGVPADNRLRLRHSAVTVGTRMRRQSTNAVVRDYVEKLDEALARQAPLAPELAQRTTRIVDVLWQQAQDGTPTWGTAPPPEDASSLSAGMVEQSGDPMVVPQRFGAHMEMADPTEPVQWNETWARPGDEEIFIGAILMPFGLITCGALLIAGLIVLIAGEVQNGNWDGTTHADDAIVQ